MLPLVIVAALVAVVLWGVSPVAAKIAVNELPTLTVAVLRTVIGGLAALPIVILFRAPWPKNTDQQLLLILSGFCGFVGFLVLFTIGVKWTSANHASMILACLPIFTGAIAMIWDRTLPHNA